MQMPKSSGQSLKVIRTPAPPPFPSRPIKRFDQPALGPHHNPTAGTAGTPSNALAAKAVRLAADPGNID
jgi:hypothetical protein